MVAGLLCGNSCFLSGPHSCSRPLADTNDEESQKEQQEKIKEEDDEEALQKARDWDDWKDTHPRGYGNRQNMGWCSSSRESRAWKSCKSCLCLTGVGINALYICRGILGFSASHWNQRSERDNLLWFTWNVRLTACLSCAVTAGAPGSGRCDGSGCLCPPSQRKSLKEKYLSLETALCIVGGCIYFFLYILNKIKSLVLPSSPCENPLLFILVSSRACFSWTVILARATVGPFHCLIALFLPR